MGLKMQPEVISREFVKPPFSTSHIHPTIHNLSIFDQLGPHIYMPLLFFYTSQDTETDQNHTSCLLKSSLSTALSHYYPLAGRIKDDVTVDCNDDGALFLEAQIECNLSEILINPDDETLKLLCPENLCYQDSLQTGPVVVQVTYFKCGGMSIGLCLCHRVMDMATMSSFINEWASLARKSDQEIIIPEFNIGSLYPPLDLSFAKQAYQIPPGMKKLSSRRLVFHGSKIAQLKEKVEDQVMNPTRIEVVTALLYKSAISAASIASYSGALKSSAMNHAINMRTLVSPPLSSRNKGNLVGVFQVLVPENIELALGRLVKEFRQSKSRFSDSCANTSNGEEPCSLTLKNMKPSVEHETYICTSWCRNSFYESNFRRGKPIWVTTILAQVENTMCLMDTSEGDGMEVFISLEDKVMAAFEQDEQLFSYCSINPCITGFCPSV